MSTVLFRGPLFAAMILVVAFQFYSPQVYSKTLSGSAGINASRLVSTVARPVAGRNRRNVAMSSYRSRYPRALNDQITVPSHTNKLRINVLSNDSGNSLRIKEVNKQSAKGGRVFLQGRHVVYLPKRNFRGWDSFWYAVVDVNGRRHSAKVNICLCDR